MPPTSTTLGFITRIPHTLSSVSQVITQALAWDTWHRLDDETRYQCLELCHYGMAQRWLIVQSNAALERAEATLTKARQREEVAITKPLFHLTSHTFPDSRGGPRRAERPWPSAGRTTKSTPPP